MAGRRRKTLASILAALAMGAATVGAAAALAADAITADATCCTFDAAQYFANQGEVPQLTNPGNADAPHNAAATEKGPDGKALFRSGTIPAGRTGPVAGTQYLSAGTYRFLCTIHGSPMRSRLIVGDEGAPVARPKIDATLPAQTLNKVRSSGKLTVKVKALTKSSGISLTARKGRKTLGSKSGLSLAAGQSRTIKLRLTASGKRALSNLGSASVSVKASVAFGKSDSASRRLF